MVWCFRSGRILYLFCQARFQPFERWILPYSHDSRKVPWFPPSDRGNSYPGPYPQRGLQHCMLDMLAGLGHLGYLSRYTYPLPDVKLFSLLTLFPCRGGQHKRSVHHGGRLEYFWGRDRRPRWWVLLVWLYITKLMHQFSRPLW
jgi:hypothetical protein